MDERVRELARRQHWVATAGQLRALGMSRGEIAWALRRRRLRRRHRGVFVVDHDTPPPLAVETAALLAVGPNAALSHESAAFLHTLLPHPARPVHVSVIGRSLAPRSDIAIHNTKTLTRADRCRRAGLSVTALPRTVLDLAATRNPDELEPLVAEAMRRLRVPERALREQLRRHPRGRGTASLRQVLDGPGGPAFTRSKAERRLLALVRAARLPPPRSCAHIAGYEVDLLWPGHRLIVEFDGFAYHGDRSAFEADRRRDATLHSLGYVVLRVTWRRLVDEPHAVVALIATMLERRAPRAA